MAIFPRLELGIRRLELLWSVIAILVAIVLEPCAIYCYYLKSKFADVVSSLEYKLIDNEEFLCYHSLSRAF